MPSEKKKPEVIELDRYRRAAAAKAEREAKAAKANAPAKESFLGSRPKAGLLLVLIALVFIAVWAAPTAIRLLSAGR